MGHRLFVVAALAILVSIPGWPLFGVTTTWFDINPSRSNLDPTNPNGASGGRVNHVGAASDFSKVYAATEWGGLYHSFDQGSTWTRINTFAPSSTWDVKVDPANSRRVYATSAFDGRTNSQAGISFSDDAGDTWTAVDIARLNALTCVVRQRLTQPTGWQIAISPASSRRVFVGTSCGLARTLDGGANWDFVDPSPADNAEQIYAVIAQSPRIVDVIGDNGHLRSTDDGNTWTAVPSVALPGPTSANSGVTSSITASPRESYVLLASNFQNGVNNIWESDNGGASWPTSLTPPTLNGGSIAQGRIPFIKTNQLSSSSQFDVYFGDMNLFKTTAITPSTLAAGGSSRVQVPTTWTSAQTNGHADVGDIMFDPRFQAGACPSLFTNDGGVYVNTRTINPTCQSPTWEQPVITPHATWIWGFDGWRRSAGTHALTYGLQDNGGYAATNVAEGYNPPLPNWNNYSCCDVLNNAEGDSKILSTDGFFGGPRGFLLFIRNQDGTNAREIPNYPSNQAITNLGTMGNRRKIARFGSNAYVVTLNDGVYFTNNIGANPIAWTSLNSPAAVVSGSGSVAIATTGGASNVYYFTGNTAPSSQGLIFRSPLAAVTGAPGSNWTQLPLPRGIGTVTAWDVDPTNGNRLIISGINTGTQLFEIWSTTNFGASWTRRQNLENLMLGVTAGATTFLNLVQQGPTAFAYGTAYWQPSLFKYNPLDSTTIVAGAIDAGVFLSLNDGADWELISRPTNPTSNSPHIPRPLFAYFSPGRFSETTNSFDVWVGTRGAGVMKAVIDQ